MDLNKSTFLSAENIRGKLQQMNSEMKNNIQSEMKEMKERLDTLTATLEENKDEGQFVGRLTKMNTSLQYAISEFPCASVSKRV